MPNLVETESYKDVLEMDILMDDYTENPRDEWDHETVFVTWHPRYTIGGKGDRQVTMSDFRSADEVRRAYVPDDAKAYKPLYLFDHSGLRLSVKDFGDRWDSGQVGWVYVPGDSGSLDPLGTIDSEVEEFDDYLAGNIYSVVVRRDNEVLDSLSGLYGLDYARNQAQEMAESTYQGLVSQLDFKSETQDV